MLVAGCEPELHFRRDNRSVVAKITVFPDLEHLQLLDERGIERHYPFEVVFLQIQVLEAPHTRDEMWDCGIELI